MVVLSQSGTESVPRQLQIIRDRFPHCVLRSEDAQNAFPSAKRISVLRGLEHFRDFLIALPAEQQNESTNLMLQAIEECIKYLAVYRSLPNHQWVNVAGTLRNLHATGACVQGGILDMFTFCVMYTFEVLVPLQEANEDVGVLSIADDLYTFVKNLTTPTSTDEVPKDIKSIAKASHDFVRLAGNVGIQANIPKVHTDQPIAAAGTIFDLEPHLHLFPKNPNPTENLPPILPLTRDGFKVAGAWQGPPKACLRWFHELVKRLRRATRRLVDPRLRNVTTQVKWSIFRMCYRSQAKLTNAMRAMVPSETLLKASKQQQPSSTK